MSPLSFHNGFSCSEVRRGRGASWLGALSSCFCRVQLSRERKGLEDGGSGGCYAIRDMRHKRFPELPEQLPRRGNLVSKLLARSALWLLGWRFAGSLPPVRKAVLIVAPHTSNWDFVIGVAALFAIGVRVAWLGKHTIFRRPWGILMRWLDGIPLDRRQRGVGAVEHVVEILNSRSTVLLGLSPEGTRRPVEQWRSGFYFIALGAGIPIVPVALDYATHTIVIGEPLTPSGDYDRQLAVLMGFFAAMTPKHESGWVTQLERLNTGASSERRGKSSE